MTRSLTVPIVHTNPRDPPTLKIQPGGHLPVLVVVEGLHDVSFLTRLSSTLAREDPSLPDLAALVEDNQIVLIPIGGGNPLDWTHRFAALGSPEFHLFDRESPPESVYGQLAAARVNARINCLAFVTTPRALENYLHPVAIAAANPFFETIEFGPDDCVPTMAARLCHEAVSRTPWRELNRFQRAKLAQKAKPRTERRRRRRRPASPPSCSNRPSSPRRKTAASDSRGTRTTPISWRMPDGERSARSSTTRQTRGC
jgi:hypothetical protein